MEQWKFGDFKNYTSLDIEKHGLYYFILSKMAWKNISIIEIISTTNEFTLVLNNDDVGDALKTLMELKL